jgi:hypothetical protein
MLKNQEADKRVVCQGFGDSVMVLGCMTSLQGKLWNYLDRNCSITLAYFLATGS